MVSQLNNFLSDSTKLYFNPSAMKLNFKYFFTTDFNFRSFHDDSQQTNVLLCDASERLLAVRKAKKKLEGENLSFPKKALLFVVHKLNVG